jgi:tetratricopeptide (TPR) repeat protein
MFRRVRVEEYRQQLYRTTYRHGDLVEPDLVVQLDSFTGKPASARKLQAVSPFSPYPLQMLVEEDWGYSKAHVATWEKEHQHHVGVLDAIGARYLQFDQLDDAERCFKRCVELSASRHLYERLADVYARRGDRQQWQATLDAFLAKPDYALDHASIRVRVANHFMDERQWDQALPYAKAAAETHAAWAMDCLVRCYESMHNYDEGEKWLLERINHYGSGEFMWYSWCRRTGHGDLAAARAAVETRLTREGESASGVSAGMFLLCEDRLEEAYQAFARQQLANKDPAAGLLAATVAAELEETDDRDAALELVISEGGKYQLNGQRRNSLIALAQMWLRTLQSEKPAIDAGKLKKLHDKADFDQLYIDYFASRILDNEDRADEAETFLRLCASLPRDHIACTLARTRLREQGLDPDAAPDEHPDKTVPSAAEPVTPE